MKLSDEILIEISYVQISSYREKVMQSLLGEIKIPSVLSRDSGVRDNHISRILGELKDHGLVECINPEERKGRLYRLTDKGEEVALNLDSINRQSQ